MKMLSVAIASLVVSLLFQCDADAQFRYGRYGGFSINIPLGGYGYGHSHYGHGHGGYGHGGYGPHVGIPIYPVPNYRVPAYRVPAYRVPIYTPYTPRVQTFSFRIEPSRRYVTPSQPYVYPQPFIDPMSENGAGNPLIGSTVIDENSLVQSAGVLQQSLSRRSDDADIWLDYLKPGLIVDTVQSGGDGSTLRELLKNYDGLSGNADLSDLWVLPGFRRTHQGLRTYVNDAANRVQEQPKSEPNTEGELPTPI